MAPSFFVLRLKMLLKNALKLSLSNQCVDPSI